MTALDAFPGRNAPIPVTEQAREDQVANDGGGFGFAVDDWSRLSRFLILGTEGGTYYVSAKELTADNAQVINRCLAADWKRTIDTIVEISVGGRAPKNDQAIFALAVASGASDPAARAYALSHLGEVCRIGTHLFQFVGYAEKFRGWGRALRTAVGKWYLDKDEVALQVQLAKYQSRGGWSHADLLRLAKPTPERSSVADRSIGWATNRAKDSEKRKDVDLTGLAVLDAFERAQKASSVKELISVITACPEITWEMVPSELLKSPEVWEAFLPNLGLTALLRNLGRLTSIGLLGQAFGATDTLVAARLTDPAALKRARVHPFAVLLARETYGRGQGDKGSLTWAPSGRIMEALAYGFEAAFSAVEPAGKRTLLALDVSGSMSDLMMGSSISCRLASAAMALVTVRTEPWVECRGFSSTFMHLPVSAKMSLAQLEHSISGLDFGETDASLPHQWAISENVDLDTIVIYTDNDINAGSHPYPGLEKLRQKLGHDVKEIVVAMTSTGFTIADPHDASSLDMVGFDTNGPSIISSFSAGRI
jgi:60 kDa SS-A/Ro ribonucleoprotein